MRLASPATAATLAVLAVLLAAGQLPLTLLARQSVVSNSSQLVVFLPIAAVGGSS